MKQWVALKPCNYWDECPHFLVLAKSLMRVTEKCAGKNKALQRMQDPFCPQMFHAQLPLIPVTHGFEQLRTGVGPLLVDTAAVENKKKDQRLTILYLWVQ